MRLTVSILLGLLVVAACTNPGAAATSPLPAAAAAPTGTPTPAPTGTHTPSPTVTLFPTPTTQTDRIIDEHGVEMVLIPAGVFIMGSDTGLPDEQPVHAVYLDAFYIDLNETTNAEYRACVDAGVCQPPDYIDCCASPGTQWYSLRPDYFYSPEYDNYPVTWLSWAKAATYCEWRGTRLPTEAEWEKAARGTDGRLYPWGNEQPTPELANFIWWEGDFDQRPLYNTAPVGSYPAGASPYSVLDMAGNLYEWVQDLYDPTYYARSPYANPQGPTEEEGSWQIARGGSFWNKPDRLRIPNRNHTYLPPDVGHFDAGVRCAKDPPSG